MISIFGVKALKRDFLRDFSNSVKIHENLEGFLSILNIPFAESVVFIRFLAFSA